MDMDIEPVRPPFIPDWLVIALIVLGAVWIVSGAAWAILVSRRSGTVPLNALLLAAAGVVGVVGGSAML